MAFQWYIYVDSFWWVEDDAMSTHGSTSNLYTLVKTIWNVISQTFLLVGSDPKDLLNRIPFQDYDRRDDDYLSEKVVSEFSHILTLYMDFLQREKFSKLKKLRRSQADLPIAEYRNEIIGKLKDNQARML